MVISLGIADVEAAYVMSNTLLFYLRLRRDLTIVAPK